MANAGAVTVRGSGLRASGPRIDPTDTGRTSPSPAPTRTAPSSSPDVLVEFEIPAVPPSKNDIGQRSHHWSWRAARANEWSLLVAGHSPPVPPRAIDSPVEVEITFFTQRPRDAGNQHDFVLDGLVGSWLKDDNRDIVRWLHLASRSCKEHPTGKPATRVRIWRA